MSLRLVKPVDVMIVDIVLSNRRSGAAAHPPGYDVKTLCEQFDASHRRIRQLLRGGLNPQRSADLIEEMRVACVALNGHLEKLVVLMA